MKEEDKRKIDVHLKEFDQLVTEVRSIQETQRRTVLLIAPALTVGVPILMRSVEDAFLHTALSFAFSLMFLLIAGNYVGLTRRILHISNYLMDYLAAEVNALVDSPDQRCMRWQIYLRSTVFRQSRNLLGLILIMGAEFMLLLLPALVCYGLGVHFGFERYKGIVFTCTLLLGLIACTVARFALITIEEVKVVRSITKVAPAETR